MSITYENESVTGAGGGGQWNKQEDKSGRVIIMYNNIQHIHQFYMKELYSNLSLPLLIYIFSACIVSDTH